MMTQKSTLWTNSLFILFLVTMGCGTKKESGYSHLLKEKKQKIRSTTNLPIEYTLYRVDDSLCKLYYRLNPKDFLAKLDSNESMQIAFSMQLNIHPNQLGSKNLFSFESNKKGSAKEEIFDSISFSLPELKTVFYELELIDQNKHVSRKISAFWQREELNIPEDFKLVDIQTAEVYTQSFVENDSVWIRSNTSENLMRLEIFTQSNTIATEMYQMENNPMYADPETPEVKFGNIKEVNEIVNDYSDEAYFRMRERSDEWKPSFCFTKLNKQPKQDINPLVYLVGQNSPVTVGNWMSYWIAASSGDVNKAEKLIREFQRRVEYANHHFSSHKLGWKTDRGMMYILLGPPDRISNDLRSEVWSYGFTSSVSQEFSFARNPNGLNADDFVLDRNLGYREIHFSAIERWKNGWVNYGWDGNQ